MYGRNFFDNGVDAQWRSKTPEEARAQRKISCDLCAGKYALNCCRCDRCPIEYAHETVMLVKFGIDINKEKRDE